MYYSFTGCCQPVAWKRKLPGYRPATSYVHYTTSCNTQSSAPKDGRDQRPKHVELFGIINKPLLLRLVDICIIYIKRCTVKQISSQDFNSNWTSDPFRTYVVFIQFIFNNHPLIKLYLCYFLIMSINILLKWRIFLSNFRE